MNGIPDPWGGDARLLVLKQQDADFVAWLLEQIAEDERHLNFCECGTIHSPEGFCQLRPGCPRRIATECDAKRQLVDLYLQMVAKHLKWERDDRAHDFIPVALAEASRMKHVLIIMSLPYHDRPGYREEWAQ